MTIEFNLPEVSEGVESADVAEIHVSEGDVITANQVVAEVETEKALAEIECPHAGKIVKVHVSSGDSLDVGAPLLTIEESGEEGADSETAQAPAEEQEAPAAEESADQAPAEEKSPAPQTSGGGGTVDFTLPEVSEGVESADIAEIRVSEGDEISANQIVAEVETEKALAEIECPYAGTVVKVHVSAGQSANVGDPILTIDQSGAGGGDQASKQEKSEPAADAPKDKPAASAGSKPQAPEPKKPAASAPAAARPPVSAPSDSKDRPPAPAGPATRRLARDLGVDLYQVNGKGPGGRISQEDVQEYVKAKMTAPAASPASGPVAAPPLPDFSEFGETHREPLNKIGKTAAEHLARSWNVIPHVTQHDHADITDIELARKQFLQGTGKNGPKVTMTAIAVKAAVTALKTFPKFNSSLDSETHEIVYKDYFNIGIAVDTENGLVVPVVRNADKKSLLQIALEVTELAIKARDRKLGMKDMQGGTFTITNLGGIGGTAFTPIVSYPEVAILGMSRGQKELKLIDGELEERLILPLSLSYDHRVINGADAARFIVKLSALMSDPFTLLSEC